MLDVIRQESNASFGEMEFSLPPCNRAYRGALDVQLGSGGKSFREQKVVAVTRKDQVYSILRQAIISSQLAPGEAIRKELVALQLGVSRAPVSDAINRLADEGLVEIYPQTGTFVARLRLDKIETAQFVRIALETAAIRRAAERSTADIVQRLRDNLDRQRKAADSRDFEGFYALDEELHDMICDAAGLVGLRGIAAKGRRQSGRGGRLLPRHGTRTVAKL